jgi:hypothetical protein
MLLSAFYLANPVVEKTSKEHPTELKQKNTKILTKIENLLND